MSYRFDADTEVVYYAGGPAALQPLTMCGWMYRTNTRASVCWPITFLDSGVQLLQGAVLDATNNDLAVHASGGPTEGSPRFVVSSGTWYHIAITRSGNTHSLYVDGVLIHSYTDSVAGTISYIAIGGNSNTFWLDGRMAQVRVWEAALTGEELFQERQSTVAQRTTNLWADWPLDSTNLLNDVSGNSRTLTASGSPSQEADPPIGGNVYFLQGNAFQFGQYRDGGASTTTLTADPGSLTLSGSTSTFRNTLAATAETLTLAGGTAVFVNSLLSSPSALTLGGQTATFNNTLLATPGSLTLTGEEATFRTVTNLIADPGALTLSGATATFNNILSAAPGALVLTGQDVTFRTILVADSNTLTLSGDSATFNNVLSASSETLTLNGQNADFIVSTRLTADPGTLTLSGESGLFVQSLQATPGTLTLGGEDATFTISIRLVADPETLTLTSNAANFVQTLNAAPGEITLTGGEAAFSIILNAVSNSLLLTGGDVTFVLPAGSVLTADPGNLTLVGGEATFRTVFDPIAYMGARPTIGAGGQGGGLIRKPYSKTRFRQENMKWPGKGK